MSSQVVQGTLDQIDASGLTETDNELYNAVAALPGVERVEYVQVLAGGDRFQAHVHVTDDVETHGREFEPERSTEYGDPLSVWDVREAVVEAE